ncbi:MAG: peptide deformylase [Capnocytophaga sp.]|nr:peptide deformylase [Capnocytophaga sp.]
MTLPIVAYGDPVLRKICTDITTDYPNLAELIANMYETMEASHGVGLAAPQIGLPIRLFVIDTKPFSEDDDLSEDEKKFLQDFRKTFINARITSETGEIWAFNEGCLSIPGVREDVRRHADLTIEYFDENFQPQTLALSGLAARVVQHEYDHIEGILFTDKLSSFKKRILNGKLSNISKGKVDVDYRMRFPNAKKSRN